MIRLASIEKIPYGSYLQNGRVQTSDPCTYEEPVRIKIVPQPSVCYFMLWTAPFSLLCKDGMSVSEKCGGLEQKLVIPERQQLHLQLQFFFCP